MPGLDSIRIICVDDDPDAHVALRAAFTAIGAPFCATYFGSPGRALAAHRAQPADIVLCDLRLGSMTGLELIADMASFAPGSVYMLISGEADLRSALRALNETRVYRFLTKPTAVSDLSHALCDAAAEISRRRSEAISLSGLSAIDRINLAVAILDQDYRVAHANSRAREIFEESDLFAASPRAQLRLHGAAETREFHKFLSEIGDASDGGSPGGVFRIERPDHRASVVVSAARCPGRGGKGSYIGVIISDPARQVFASALALAAALKIAPSEARVVFNLAEGANVSEAARRAGVSVNTARTYIKNVFTKTGVSRQAELVRLALLSAA